MDYLLNQLVSNHSLIGIIFVAIGGYYINGYSWLFYWWLVY
jgi:hypothetical protein